MSATRFPFVSPRILTLLAVAGLLGAACSSAAETSTGTVSATTTPASTVPATTAAPATTIAVTTSAPAAPSAETLSFSSKIQPILESSCASCHTAGGPGATHLPLETAEQAGKAARDIAGAAESRAMPPWPASKTSLAFQHDRSLTVEQIDALVQWASNGGLLDIDPTTALQPTRPAAPPIERDAVIKGLPYSGTLEKKDDYRCQIYDPKLTKTSWLQGMDLEPDQTAVVHHGLLFRAPASARAAAEELDAKEPGTGWTCFGLPSLGRRGDGSLEQIMSWGPGQSPEKLPADTGIVMEAGDFLVGQVHYHYSDETITLPPDESAFVVDFASDEVIAAAGGKLDPVSLTLYLAPAEIPCSTSQSGPLCDRDAAVADLVRQFGPSATFIANGLLLGCGGKVEDFAGMTDGKASASCEHDAKPGEIVSVWGHEHEIGTSFKMTLNPGKPDERVLLDIPRWSFDWQLNYYPVDKVVLKPGDRIGIECSWDRRRAPAGNEPRYIVWGEGTNDEMCFSQIVTRPAEQ